MPTMTGPQERSWHALLDLHERRPTGWTLVGGQMVHLHCAERGASPVRPTDDADTVLDVRAEPYAHMQVTTTLRELGFTPAVETWNGHQHRWAREDDAVVDVLIPRHLGERAAKRKGAGGGTTLETPGAQQALDRTEDVEVVVGGRTGSVRRPNLLGALVAKAAAHTVSLDTRRARHVTDFAVLATLVRPDDELHTARARDRQYLRRMLTVMAEDPRPWAAVAGAADGLERVRLALRPRTAPARPTGGAPAGWGRSRTPAGTPAGGQLATRRRGEPDVRL